MKKILKLGVVWKHGWEIVYLFIFAWFNRENLKNIFVSLGLVNLSHVGSFPTSTIDLLSFVFLDSSTLIIHCNTENKHESLIESKVVIPTDYFVSIMEGHRVDWHRERKWWHGVKQIVLNRKATECSCPDQCDKGEQSWYLVVTICGVSKIEDNIMIESSPSGTYSPTLWILQLFLMSVSASSKHLPNFSICLEQTENAISLSP